MVLTGHVLFASLPRCKPLGRAPVCLALLPVPDARAGHNVVRCFWKTGRGHVLWFLNGRGLMLPNENVCHSLLPPWWGHQAATLDLKILGFCCCFIIQGFVLLFCESNSASVLFFLGMGTPIVRGRVRSQNQLFVENWLCSSRPGGRLRGATCLWPSGATGAVGETPPQLIIAAFCYPRGVPRQ